MTRILALDWGEVRIGAAISDEGRKIAFPLKQPIDNKTGIDEIKKIVAESEVRLVLLGLPKNLAGQEGTSAKKLKTFAHELFDSIHGVSIKLIDERFTTVEAGKLLKSQGLSEKQQRGIKDNIAAQLILQQYLDTRLPTPERGDGGQAKNK